MIKLITALLCLQLTYSFLISPESYDSLLALSDAPEFSLEGNMYLAKIVDIYDGDSVKGVIELCGEFKRFNFRLDGIDTPEIRSGVVRDFGKQVRDILIGMIEGKIVKLIAGEADKYGRVLCRIIAQQEDGTDVDINQYQVDHGMAKAYDGGTKDEFDQGDYDYFIQNYRNTEWPTFKDYPLD